MHEAFSKDESGSQLKQRRCERRGHAQRRRERRGQGQLRRERRGRERQGRRKEELEGR